MLEVLIYISAVVTTLSIVGCFYFKSKSKKNTKLFKDQESEIMRLANQVTTLQRVVNKYKGLTPANRIALLEWDGWHKEKEPNITWQTKFELREVGISEDETSSKFEVISVTSENIKDVWGKTEYEKYFLKTTGGGWINTQNPGRTGQKMKLIWITDQSKSQKREMKLNQLLNNDEDETETNI
jgi:hypothetical protein